MQDCAEPAPAQYTLMIDLRVDPSTRSRTIARARERGIVIPTLAQLKDPSRVGRPQRDRLRAITMSAVDPANLFRITWHNEPREVGGGFGAVNVLEFPSALTGVPARIVALVGRWFPTGSHKVGAAFGCLVPRLITGQFDPKHQRAVWPSTGNFCRGGAYDSALLGCHSVAVLPTGMSRERFEWLEHMAVTVLRTPGSESNVKEIFDECWRLTLQGPEFEIFNQFAEFGNYLWHHSVTGGAMLEVLHQLAREPSVYRGLVLTTGSAGTVACGDLLKAHFPNSKIVVGEALQCPTLLENGHGEHRIEGIGDKHVPWIHNVRSMDMVVGIDDRAALAILRLFNEPAGLRHLAHQGVSDRMLAQLSLVGISGMANLIGCIKFAKCCDLGPDDIVLTVLTDSVDLYRSRIEELRSEGELTDRDAAAIHRWALVEQTTDAVEELTERGRRRIHNLKYFTWVEQQQKSVIELDAQWHPDHWRRIAKQEEEIDALIGEFNAEVES
jgi:cysteine synthase A